MASEMRQPFRSFFTARDTSPGGQGLWRVSATLLLLLVVGISGLPPTILIEVEASESPVEESENETSEEYIGTRSPLRVSRHRQQVSFHPVDRTSRGPAETRLTRSGAGHFLPNGLSAPMTC